MKVRILLAAAMGLFAAGLPANAAQVKFALTYTGSFGSNATGTGFVVFDDSVLPNGPVSLNRVSASTLGIMDFSITISGATDGNGTWRLEDYQAAPIPDDWFWNLDAPLDLSAELVGQAGFLDFNWCAYSESCELWDAPGGVDTREISLLGEEGENLVLVSMRPVPMSETVPLPAAAWLLLSGLGGLGFIGRRRKTH